MADTKYTQQQIELLKGNDTTLRRSETEKFADYKSVDPFPHIGEALLNSADLLMYLLTVGIVEPFNVDNLKGVTYACTFSGEAHKYNPEKGIMEEIHVNDDEELILEQNSITYLKLEEKFHVPEYMVLRFNLSVSNAYKGVLLGTGPIVDPGFEGNLFIPLHNLTGNEYVIKKGASLIRVEFTKLSSHSKWCSSSQKNKGSFSQIKPITKPTPKNANFSDFIEESLLGTHGKKFYNKSKTVCVRSSIPEAIAESAKRATQAEKSVNVLKKFGIGGILAALLSIAALFWGGYQLISDTNARYDSMYQYVEYYKDVDRKNQETINELENRVVLLEIDSKQRELEILNKEYASYIDQNSDLAKKTYQKIVQLETEIAELKKLLK